MSAIETIKAIKEYGMLAVAVVIFFWMNDKLSSQDEKIERIESKLYDCFEQRIKDNTRNNIFGNERHVSLYNTKSYAIIPEEIKIKKA